jgi:hypothetical protein
MAVLLSALGMTLLGAVTSASAAIPFCPPGSGAGQCKNPSGIAVDTELKRIYVADTGNHRIAVFDTGGNFLMAFGWGVFDGNPTLQSCVAVCQKGIAGTGTGQFSAPKRVAVDDDPASPAHHAVYVGTEGFRLQKFTSAGEFERMWGWDVVASGPGNDVTAPIDEFEVCVPANGDVCKSGASGSGAGAFSGGQDPLAVGPGGLVHVGDSPSSGSPRIERFASTGAFTASLPLPFKNELVAIAVDSAGDIYAYSRFDELSPGINKFQSDGTPYGSPYPLDPELLTTSLAVDASDRLIVGQALEGIRPLLYSPVALYDSSGARLSRFAYAAINSFIDGLGAFDSPAGQVFATDNADGIEYLAVPDPGPLVVPGSVEATNLSNTKATLRAEINPEGKPTEYHFDYVEQAEFDNQGGFEGPATQSTPSQPLGSDFNLHLAVANIGCPNPLIEAGEEGKCLTPATEYRFRVVAINADDEVLSEAEFSTKPGLDLLETWSTEVGVDAARLHAEVNPLGIPATGYFEYVDDATYLDSGFAEALRIPGVDAEPPQPALDFGAGEAPQVRSVLLDGLELATTYHYRLVADNPLIDPIEGPERTFATFAPITTPPPCPNDEFRTGSGAFLPDCRAYELVSPLEKNGGDILPLEEPSSHRPAAIDLASTTGDRFTYGTSRSFGNPEGAPYISQYLAARDEEKGWVTHNLSPPRGITVLPLSPGLQLDTEFRSFSANLCQAWPRTITEPPLEAEAVKGYANIYRRTDQDCGGLSWEALTRVKPPDRPPEEYYPLELQGVSENGSKAIYLAPDNLTADAPDIAEGTAGLNGAEDNVQLYEWDGNQLRFVCILPNEEAHTGSCSAGTADNARGTSRTANVDNALSADGSRIFWTATSGDVGAGPIYVRIDATRTVAVSADAEAIEGTDVSRQFSRYWGAARDGSVAIFSTGGGLYEFVVDTETSVPIGGSGLIGVMGASDDASRVYFASNAVLSGEEPNGEGDVAKDGEPNLYLWNEGEISFIGTLAASDVNALLEHNPVAVQPLARTSRVSPDGGHAVFTSAASLTGYDNKDAKNGKADAEVYRYVAEDGGLICASCNPSGVRPVGANIQNSDNPFWAAAQIPPWLNILHASRVMSDDGSRVYFQALDALVSRDTNGVEDVYQWEEEGAGDCSAANPNFAPSSEGCIELVSSGKSPRNSEFVDADASGKNVFIRTLSSLVPQDYGLLDIYDARAGGGFPPPNPPPPGCEGEACQVPLPPPQAPSPASSSEGPGNEKAPSKSGRSCPSGKHKVRKAGKNRCVKNKKGRRTHRRRGGSAR